MSKRKLAVVMMSLVTAVVLLNLALAIALAQEHRPYVVSLAAAMTACVPGFVVAALAWKGRLPSRCAPQQDRRIGR